MTLKKDSHVVTNKGNYGRVVSIEGSIAKVKIGYKVHDIDLCNITDVTDGIHVRVDYIDENGANKDTLVFVKHLTILFDSNDKTNDNFINKIKHSLSLKTNQQKIIITKIMIP